MVVPAPGFLLIEILEDDNKTKEGIYLPQDLADEPMKGKVVAVGRPRQSEYEGVIAPPDFVTKGGRNLVSIDDVIYFKPHTAHEIKSYDKDVKWGFIPFEVVMGLEVSK